MKKMIVTFALVVFIMMSNLTSAASQGLETQAQDTIKQEFQWSDNYDVAYFTTTNVTKKYVVGKSKLTDKKHRYHIKYVSKDTKLTPCKEFAVVTDPSNSDKIVTILEVSVD